MGFLRRLRQFLVAVLLLSTCISQLRSVHTTSDETGSGTFHVQLGKRVRNMYTTSSFLRQLFRDITNRLNGFWNQSLSYIECMQSGNVGIGGSDDGIDQRRLRQFQLRWTTDSRQDLSHSSVQSMHDNEILSPNSSSGCNERHSRILESLQEVLGRRLLEMPEDLRIPMNSLPGLEGGQDIVSASDAVTPKFVLFDPYGMTSRHCSSIITGRFLFSRGDFMCSQDMSFFFGIDDDGELGIWKGSRKVWFAGTCCFGGGTFADLQRDGNFVVYSPTGEVLWKSNTDGPWSSGAELKLENNGVVTIENQADPERFLAISPKTDLKECDSELVGVARLDMGDYICSNDEQFQFGLSRSGDLGVWNGPVQVWSSGTCCKGDGVVVYLQTDGNLVVRSSDGTALWQSGTSGGNSASGLVQISNEGVVTISNQEARKRLIIVANKPKPDVLLEEFSTSRSNRHCVEQVFGRIILRSGEFICSPNGQYRFGVTLSGDLQLLYDGSTAWKTGTCCEGDSVYAILQLEDGNLVVRNDEFSILWSSETNNVENANSSLSLGDHGLVAITNAAGKRTWAVAPKPPASACLNREIEAMELYEGLFICSSNLRYRFGVIDGLVSIWDDNIMVWSLEACCSDDVISVKMRENGNLVVLSSDRRSLWISRTASKGGKTLRLDDDGIARIISDLGEVLWASSGEISAPQPAFPSPSPPPSHPSKAPTFNAPPTSSRIDCIDQIVGRIQLEVGQFICSPDLEYRFGLDSDGDLAVMHGSRKLWSADTCCQGVTRAKLQRDGNLVVSSEAGVVWASATAGENIGTVSLVLEDDGVATITCSIRGHLWSNVVSSHGRVDTTSLEGKVMSGYQGWFFAEGDGGLNRWIHWSKSLRVPNKDSITIDMWPDFRELDADELYPTGFRYADGSNAGLYSAYNRKTVERHCKWMWEYGLHGVFVQRFIGNAMRWTRIVDTVLANVRSGAEKYGRTFVVMYDIGNGDDVTIVQDIINDWKHLVDDEKIASSKQYLHHRNRPLLAIWGFGFSDRLGEPEEVEELIRWFKHEADDKYKATLMGGLPAGWRTLSRDSKMRAMWSRVYRQFDVISPWTVGRYRDILTADRFREVYIEPDLKECEALGIDYLPVAFPGFSSTNLHSWKPFNEIPRNGGTFLWRQMHNAVEAGSRMVYIAMFDEVDEATAIFKLTETTEQNPTTGLLLPLNADAGFPHVPNDWYLQLTGKAAQLVSSGRKLPEMMPSLPRPTP